MTINDGEKLAFIVGHYKSGSTWLSHLLSLYPGVRGVRETHIFRYVQDHASLADATEELFTKSAWGSGGIKGFPRYWLGNCSRPLRVKMGIASGTASLSAQNVPTSLFDLGFINQFNLRKTLERSDDPDTFCRTFFSTLTARLKPTHYLIEKTPTNVFYVDSIKRIFPGCKLLSIHRDGRDVVISDAHHLQRTYNRSQAFSTRVEKWKSAMEAEAKMADRYEVKQLSYEELKSDPERLTSEILSYLGLPHNEDLVKQMVANASFKSMSGGRTAGVENTNTFFRKGVSGDWKTSLTPEEKREFSEIAGDYLVSLGYESSSDWENWN